MHQHITPSADERLYARSSFQHGIGAVSVIIANCPHGDRFAPISSRAVDLTRRLISADARGLDARGLSPDDLRSLRHDIEGTLAIRLRRIGNNVRLAHTVAICGQRTSSEAA